MQSTQLTCPHCNSTLSFGMAVAAGTPVQCLICMQSFSANPSAPAPAPVEPASPNPAPVVAAPIPTAKPATAVTSKIATKPPPIPTSGKAHPAAPPRPRPAATGAAGILLVVAAGGFLLLLLTAGIGLAVWKLSTSTHNPANTGDPIALNADPANGAAANNDIPTPASDGAPKPGDAKKLNLPPPTGEDLADEIRRKKEAEKNLLTRKTITNPGGSDIDFDPVSSFNLPKQAAPGIDQKKINDAIEKGLAYLKKSQNPDGAWTNSHQVGHAAIGGLTLLECGTPANNLSVSRAAAYVRTHAAANNQTYEISLAILFLDRLGDPRDRVLIQGMSLRLLAGQDVCGGWSYNCPPLPPQEMYQLFTFLQSHKKPSLHNPVAARPNPELQNPTRAPSNTEDPFAQLGNLILDQGIDGGAKPAKDAKDGKKTTPKAKPKPQTPINPNLLKPNLQTMQVVMNQGKGKGQAKVRHGSGDNSNTQFALLALWAARRHDIPTDFSLLAAYQRFQLSQAPDGGWGYQFNAARNSTHTMTCVGLLGEAMGHGTAPEVIGVNPKTKEPIIKPALQDVVIQKGLKKLSNHIGQPSMDAKRKNFPMENLYFLWSVERVAMLYDLRDINGKDWYGWGAQILVHNQQGDGHWNSANYHGHNPPLDTCFALLFLRRSNLVQDLTNHLRLHSAIRDPN